jgi:hypothetical protein
MRFSRKINRRSCSKSRNSPELLSKAKRSAAMIRVHAEAARNISTVVDVRKKEET